MKMIKVSDELHKLLIKLVGKKQVISGKRTTIEEVIKDAIKNRR